MTAKVHNLDLAKTTDENAPEMSRFPRGQTEEVGWVLDALDDLIAYCQHCGFDESAQCLIESRKTVARTVLH